MKTSISIPAPLFEEAEHFAKKHHLSRSELYRRALEAYLAWHEPESITRILDEIYAAEPSELDPVIMKMQLLSLPKDEW